MIEVWITKNGEPLATIEIKNQGVIESLLDGTEFADYSVKFGVDRGSAVGIHSRVMNLFPRNRINVLGLVRQALMLLEEKELKLEPGYDIDSPEAAVSADLARQVRGAVREIQAQVSRLHRH